uniref:Uncharacterized protein n=1 Tax=Trichuris muris TaxID=70415 RepID=A0A5S6Q7S8_TRIMR
MMRFAVVSPALLHLALRDERWASFVRQRHFVAVYSALGRQMPAGGKPEASWRLRRSFQRLIRRLRGSTVASAGETADRSPRWAPLDGRDSQ